MQMMKMIMPLPQQQLLPRDLRLWSPAGESTNSRSATRATSSRVTQLLHSEAVYFLGEALTSEGVSLKYSGKMKPDQTITMTTFPSLQWLLYGWFEDRWQNRQHPLEGSKLSPYPVRRVFSLKCGISCHFDHW